MANTIVSQSKPGILSKSITRPVIDESVTGVGRITREFMITSDRLTVGYFIRSLSDTIVIRIYTKDGVDSTERLKVYDSGGIATPTGSYVIETSEKCLSSITVEVDYTGDCEFRLTLKPTDDNGKLQELHEANTSYMQTLVNDQKKMLMKQQETNDLLVKVINHLRQVTEINDDEGETF